MRKLASFLAAVAVLGACGSQQPREALLRPVSDQRAPDTFDVSFETSQGRFVVRAVRAWAPLGVDRFHHLVSVGYYDRVKLGSELRGAVRAARRSRGHGALAHPHLSR
jgi:hypothetical protein